MVELGVPLGCEVAVEDVARSDVPVISTSMSGNEREHPPGGIPAASGLQHRDAALSSRLQSRCCRIRVGDNHSRIALPASGSQRRIAELERENRELRRANEILEAASAFLFSRGSSTRARQVVMLISVHR